MRIIALLLAFAAGAAFADGSGPLGSITQDGHKIEVFDTQGSCSTNAGLEAYRTPAATPDRPYDIGCWKPINDTSAVVVFKDGTLVMFRRADLVPRPHISL